MKFKTIKECEGVFNPYKPLDTIGSSYWYKYDNKPKMGDWMLFRHIKSEEKGATISRPILALIAGHTVWDQALVLEYVTEWRAWQIWSEIYNENVKDYYSIAHNDKKVNHIQFWTDDIIVIRHWKYKPNYRELRMAFREYDRAN